MNRLEPAVNLTAAAEAAIVFEIVSTDENLPHQLASLLDSELAAIEIAKWGHFFPAHVATWRFIRTLHPEILGEADAGYGEAPWFRGHGVHWFADTVIADPGYVDLVDGLMRYVALQLPPSTLHRGVVREDELPALPITEVRELAHLVAELTDAEATRATRPRTP